MNPEQRDGNKVLLVDIPLMDYREALELQKDILRMKKGGMLHNVILILEHPPVFTIGRNHGRENLMVSEDFLEKSGVPVYPIERGGDITYHGPGQAVVYPIIKMKDFRLSVREYVSALEEVMVRTARDFGVEASGDNDKRGAWVGPRKLGSIGIAITRGISYHGLALNVNPSLEPFSWINPCGFTNIQMTSIKEECKGARPSMKDARNSLKIHMKEIFQTELVPVGISSLRSMLKKAA